MYNPEMEKWEAFLRKSFDQIDARLEREYGDLYPLHPNRPAAGQTSSSDRDGLFNIGAAFSAGYGSRYGRGWVVEVDMVTLSRVDAERQEEIENYVARLLREKISERYPEAEIRVERDGAVYKIIGTPELEHRLDR